MFWQINNTTHPTPMAIKLDDEDFLVDLLIDGKVPMRGYTMHKANQMREVLAKHSLDIVYFPAGTLESKSGTEDNNGQKA